MPWPCAHIGETMEFTNQYIFSLVGRSKRDSRKKNQTYLLPYKLKSYHQFFYLHILLIIPLFFYPNQFLVLIRGPKFIPAVFHLWCTYSSKFPKLFWILILSSNILFILPSLYALTSKRTIIYGVFALY